MKAIFCFLILQNLFKKNNNDLPEVVVLQQKLDSAQPKIGCLNFTKLESNFKAVGGDGTNTSYCCKAMLLSESFIQICKPLNTSFYS